MHRAASAVIRDVATESAFGILYVPRIARHDGSVALSDTPSGRAWLDNFASVDQPPASLLLESLRFVSLSRLSRGLKDRLEGLMAEGAIQAPALVIPERDLEDLGVEKADRDT